MYTVVVNLISWSKILVLNRCSAIWVQRWISSYAQLLVPDNMFELVISRISSSPLHKSLQLSHAMQKNDLVFWSVWWCECYSAPWVKWQPTTKQMLEGFRMCSSSWALLWDEWQQASPGTGSQIRAWTFLEFKEPTSERLSFHGDRCKESPLVIQMCNAMSK